MKKKTEIYYIGLIDESNLPSSCPLCKDNNVLAKNHMQSSTYMTLKGPFTRYQHRENELFFDLKEKYLECTNCRSEIKVIDFQVLVEEISVTIPPEKARAFSMKMMDLYRESSDYAIEKLSILTGDFKAEPVCGKEILKEVEKLIQGF